MTANKNHSLHPQQRNLWNLVFERDADEDKKWNIVCMNYSQIIISVKSLPFDDDALLVVLEQIWRRHSQLADNMVKLVKRWHAVLTQYFQPATGTLSAGHW